MCSFLLYIPSMQWVKIICAFCYICTIILHSKSEKKKIKKGNMQYSYLNFNLIMFLSTLANKKKIINFTLYPIRHQITPPFMVVYICMFFYKEILGDYKKNSECRFEFSSLSLQKYLHDSSKKFSVMMKTFWKRIVLLFF